MKRVLLFLLVIILMVNICNAQKKSDFLKKYSYMCFGIANNQAETGTCFFYKYQSNVYCISNYHVFHGTNPFSAIQNYNIDTLRVVYFSKRKVKRICLIPIKDDLVLLKHFDMPDIEAHEIKKPKDFTINMINDLLDQRFFDIKPDSIISYGYPSSLQQAVNVSTYIPIISKYTGIYLDEFSSKNDIDYGLSALDSRFRKTEIYKNIKNTEFEITIHGEPGNSGSPIFGKYIIGNQVKYKFVGILFAGSTSNSLAVKASYIYKYLTSIKSSE